MVIDPPADVIRPRIRTIRPPCIVTGFGIEMAKRINVPSLQELGHGIAFLRIVPGIVLIRLRTRQINLGMSNIIVSAQNNVLPGLDQFVAVPFYRSDEGELVLDTLAFGLTVRNIQTIGLDLFYYGGVVGWCERKSVRSLDSCRTMFFLVR